MAGNTLDMCYVECGCVIVHYDLKSDPVTRCDHYMRAAVLDSYHFALPDLAFPIQSNGQHYQSHPSLITERWPIIKKQ